MDAAAVDAAFAEDAEGGVLPAVSTSSAAFAAILDDLVRVVGEAEAGPVGDAASVDERLLRAAAERDAAAVAAGAATSTGAAASSGSAPSDPAAPIVLTATPPAAPPPARLRGRGDLTLVVGLGGDAVAASRILAESAGDAEVRPGGCARAAAPRVDDRRGALRARADGVRRERPIVAAYGLEHGASDVPALAESLAGIAPDQVWVAVDASRKTEDTASWVAAVDAVLAVDGIAATGAAFTTTPGSVDALGFPVLWLDAPR